MASNITKNGGGTSSSAVRGGIRPSNKNTNDVVDESYTFPPNSGRVSWNVSLNCVHYTYYISEGIMIPLIIYSIFCLYDF